ncbi:MAG: hypothetical protein DMD54_01205 [Gemmatimonadetes bacterium]|nr:MAG: hypothetical protein DMD54_01205 [Gemmatimonadota bacterium]
MRLVWGAVVSLVLASAAAAQSPTLTVTVQSNVPRVRSSGLLADGKFVGLMRSGFPLRLHYRLELWRVRSSWFDQYIREVSWDAVARNDPLADDFMLIRQGGSITRYATSEELASALEIPYTVTMRPSGAEGERFYFVARLEVTTLNDTDLQELSRWLSGDVGPAVSGGENFGGALARGAQRVLVRLAGLPRQRLEARSPTIRIGDR